MKSDFTQRNEGIDVLRALTMFVMIFVNDFWTVRGIPRWMTHAAGGEDFMGLADVVFPCFLFVVGMSVPYAIERRYAAGMPGESTVGHILTRTLALLLMGVFIVNSEAGLSPGAVYSLPVYRILMVGAFVCIWNQYPPAGSVRRKWLYGVLKGTGILVLLFLAAGFRDAKGGVFAARWWGILGLIGWSYLPCALVYVFTRDRLRYLIPVWAALALLSMIGNDMLGFLHLGSGTLPAFTMGGLILSILSTRYQPQTIRKKMAGAAALAGVLLLAGLLSHRYWIVSKLGETPTWLFYVSALAVALYGLIHVLAEMGKARWFRLIRPAGTATLTAYLVPYVMYSAVSLTEIRLPGWFAEVAFSIVNCLSFAFAVIGLTWLLGRVHVKLKI